MRTSQEPDHYLIGRRRVLRDKDIRQHVLVAVRCGKRHALAPPFSDIVGAFVSRIQSGALAADLFPSHHGQVVLFDKFGEAHTAGRNTGGRWAISGSTSAQERSKSGLSAMLDALLFPASFRCANVVSKEEGGLRFYALPLLFSRHSVTIPEALDSCRKRAVWRFIVQWNGSNAQ
jgi:hypothetical protein